MELSEITALAGDYDKLKGKIVATKKNTSQIAVYLKQLEPETHDVADKTKRPDKLTTTDQGQKTVEVARLSIPVQKRIVNFAAAFLCGNPIELSASPADDLQKNILAAIAKTWESNKLDYDSKKLAALMMSETEVAELWYTEEADPLYWANTTLEGKKFRLRMKILANSFGDSLYPVFNNSGDMVAFGRGYSITVEGKDQEHFDLYTPDIIYKGTKLSSGWDTTTESNTIGKIPVIYYHQPKPEWADVQTLIDRFEKTLSNHSDTNDYFCSPMVKVKGKIKGFSAKGESGKVLELENGADAEYMSWDQSPKSLELEFKNLRSLIFDLTDTPDISFEQMKSMGTFSGISLKMLFLGAHLKASAKEEVFGKCIQRRINFIKDSMAKIDVSLAKATGLEVKPMFEYFLPKNDQELVEMLVSATGSKPIMTQASAVRRNPLVEDAEKEVADLKEETTMDVLQA